jgi:hypothetical protein
MYVCIHFTGREGRERKYASDEEAGGPLEGAGRWEWKSVGVFLFFTYLLSSTATAFTDLIQA